MPLAAANLPGTVTAGVNFPGTRYTPVDLSHRGGAYSDSGFCRGASISERERERETGRDGESEEEKKNRRGRRSLARRFRFPNLLPSGAKGRSEYGSRRDRLRLGWLGISTALLHR